MRPRASVPPSTANHPSLLRLARCNCPSFRRITWTKRHNPSALEKADDKEWDRATVCPVIRCITEVPRAVISRAGCGLQAEAVAALVNARTAEAADSALAGMTGGLGAAVAAMRADTLNLLAELEVGRSYFALCNHTLPKLIVSLEVS